MARVAALIAKAERACESAAILLESGDIDGACNRAYYAMFDAARAALFTVGKNQESTRTHAGMVPDQRKRQKAIRRSRESGNPVTCLTEVERRWIPAYAGMTSKRWLFDAPEGDKVDNPLMGGPVEQSRTFVTAMRAFTESLR